MVLRVDVVDAALQAAYGEGERPRIVLLSPTGPLLDDAIADELIAEPHVALLCGRYEGFDDRVHQHLADDELSIGRYVLAGGELPAMVVADVLMRKLPGALGHEDSRRRGVLQPGARGDARVPALHPPAALPRLGGARDPALRRPREGARVAARAEPRCGPSSSSRAPSSYHSATARFPHPGPAVFSRQMSSVIDSIERDQLRKGLPSFGPGDRVRVHFQVIEGTRKRTQVFEGVVLRRQGSGVRETFTVRKQSFGVGVERTFPLHSPKIEKLEVAARGDVRRAKLYYLRGRIGKAARVAERRWGIDEDMVSAPSAARRSRPTPRASAQEEVVPTEAEATRQARRGATAEAPEAEARRGERRGGGRAPRRASRARGGGRD